MLLFLDLSEIDVVCSGWCLLLSLSLSVVFCFVCRYGPIHKPISPYQIVLTVVLDVTPRSLVEIYRRFGGTHCLLFHRRRLNQTKQETSNEQIREVRGSNLCKGAVYLDFFVVVVALSPKKMN